jgi:branched-chain amino acid transport system substrate-binding protein
MTNLNLTFRAIALAVAVGYASHIAAETRYGPGVTDTEIRIGNTMPYSGTASFFASIARAEAAYFRMINDQGGINGRKIVFISLDDGYSPPQTVEQTRKLVEQERVLLIFSAFGTATVSATQRYLSAQEVPQLFPVSGASKWDDRSRFPWIRGWQPSYQAEGRIFGRYILEDRPNAKIGVLYQNDDYGKDYLRGLRDGLGSRAGSMIVREVTYEAMDPTIDSQIIDLKASNADVFFNVTTPKFAAQAIRKMHDISWRPLHILNSISTTVSSVLAPAGLEKSVGIVSATYAKDPTDPKFREDPAVRDWLAWLTKYYPEGDRANIGNALAYSRAMTLVDVLRHCGDDLSRENVVMQADALDLELPMLLPGIRIKTVGGQSVAIREMQLERFNGKSWEHFGELIKSE